MLEPVCLISLQLIKAHLWVPPSPPNLLHKRLRILEESEESFSSSEGAGTKQGAVTCVVMCAAACKSRCLAEW